VVRPAPQTADCCGSKKRAIEGPMMRLDFSQLPLKDRAFSEKPMTFIDQAPKNFLGAILDLVAIETGNRNARENWQQSQLRNLLQHAAQRSAFWRERIGPGKIHDTTFAKLPILSRSDVARQVKAEGPLLSRQDRIRTIKHGTSGSSGTPVQFFLSEMNLEYNAVRSAAQYFLEGRDLRLNNTRLRPVLTSSKNGFTVKTDDNPLGSLGPLIPGGIFKYIEYYNPNMEALCHELERDSIGYLLAQPTLIETMLQSVDPMFFKRAGTAMFSPRASAVDSELRDTFCSMGIPVRSTYSSEEVGSIGLECEKNAGTYHITTSNVLVEVIPDASVRVGSEAVGRVLVTHLHSYATPFIRYDLGDIATLSDRCRCGHDGPVLSNVHGRSKALLKHASGRVSTLYVRARELTAVAKFDEYRIRQTAIETIVVEIGGRDSLTPEETAALVALIRRHAGDEFEVAVKAVARIDWGGSVKRLGYSCEIL
jgi:phenylacetate-coenzyme A ligase PaaK-like adenylate-forming protein